jgi:hypothetical protein
VQKTDLISDYDFSKPKTKKSTDVHPYLMTTPEKVDFRRPNEDNSQLMNLVLKGEDPQPSIADMPREDQEMLKRLIKVN